MPMRGHAGMRAALVFMVLMSHVSRVHVLGLTSVTMGPLQGVFSITDSPALNTLYEHQVYDRTPAALQLLFAAAVSAQHPARHAVTQLCPHAHSKALSTVLALCMPSQHSMLHAASRASLPPPRTLSKPIKASQQHSPQ
jgi:hypothetical protein